jgi:host factor-I protein
MTDRKLIRPNLRDYKTARREPHETREREEEGSASSSGGFGATRRKQVPPEQTNAESFYYLKQMGTKVPMVVVLMDGEELHGWVEWYDKDCIKVHRLNEPNLLVYKHAIKYLYKEREA